MAEKLKEFITKFFEQLGATLDEIGDTVIITEVPLPFERFYGKKAPYKFSFSEEVEGFELIHQNSFLIRSINDYLEHSGQTTIVKINFPFDPKKKVFEREPLMNCKLSQVHRSSIERFIVRFTFASTFQYLNKKDVVTHHINVKDGEIIEFDFDSFDLSDGQRKDVEKEYVKESYAIAKQKLQELIKPKIEFISEDLKIKLESEVARIKEHYQSHVKESEDKLERNKQRLSEETDPVHIERIKKEIEKLEKAIWEESEKGDQDFFIKDEVQKHSLNLKNKLINTTIIYYPFYTLVAYLDVNGKMKIVRRTYDPLNDSLQPLHCDCCKREIHEIILCSSGHLICRVCGNRCQTCKEIVCTNCTLKDCHKCGRVICANCEVQCQKCLKYVCRNHYTVNPQTKKVVCMDCISRCTRCGALTDPQFLNETIEQYQKLCPKCAKEKVKKDLFT